MRPFIAGNWKMHGLAAHLGRIRRIVATLKGTAPRASALLCVLPTTG